MTTFCNGNLLGTWSAAMDMEVYLLETSAAMKIFMEAEGRHLFILSLPNDFIKQGLSPEVSKN